MGKLTITIGAPGSGKSTWALKQLNKDTLLLERDRFRAAMFGHRKEYWRQADADEERHKKLSYLVGKAMYSAMWAAWQEGTHNHIILSDTGYGWDSVKNFYAFARKAGWAIEVVIFEVPLYILLNRNHERKEDGMSEAYIRSCFKNMSPDEPWWLTPGKGADIITYMDEFGNEANLTRCARRNKKERQTRDQ